MISLNLLALHFIGDFIFQNDWMALNKSKSWFALTVHCLFYSVVFVNYGMAFAGITFCLHFLTDAMTSRITSRLWFVKGVRTVYDEDRGNYHQVVNYTNTRHWFFVAIGADQLIHYGCLVWTLNLLHLTS